MTPGGGRSFAELVPKQKHFQERQESEKDDSSYEKKVFLKVELTQTGSAVFSPFNSCSEL